MRELRTSEGAFASALDADTEGVEGLFYAWSPDQLVAVTWPEDGPWAAKLFGVTAAGTFEGGLSTLQLRAAPTTTTVSQGSASVGACSAAACAPGARRQDCGLLERACDRCTGRDRRHGNAPRPRRRGAEAATFLREVHVRSMVSCAASRAMVLWGLPEVCGRLCERRRRHGCVYSVTGDVSWLTFALTLADAILERFDDGKGGLFDTAHSAERLVRRPQDPGDNASPSGQSAAAGMLLSLSALSGEQRLRDAAGSLLANTAKLQVASPRFAGWWLAVGEAWASGPQELAIVGPAGEQKDALLAVAHASTSPGLVLAVEAEGEPEGELESEVDSVALLQGRVGASVPTAYVCHHFVCDAPTQHPSSVGERPDRRY